MLSRARRWVHLQYPFSTQRPKVRLGELATPRDHSRGTHGVIGVLGGLGVLGGTRSAHGVLGEGCSASDATTCRYSDCGCCNARARQLRCVRLHVANRRSAAQLWIHRTLHLPWATYLLAPKPGVL